MTLSAKRDMPKGFREFDHIHRYWERHFDLPAAKLLPGECYVSSENEVITTVLGSCISACIRDRVTKVGGMNHFMLPIQSGESAMLRSNSVNPALCYGNWAMEFLINSVLKHGGSRNNLEIKLFGGARVLANMTVMDIGNKNVEFALDYVKKEQFSIDSQDLGGDYPRKIAYFPATGTVKMKKLRQAESAGIQKQEKAYLDSINKKPSSGDVELF